MSIDFKSKVYGEFDEVVPNYFIPSSLLSRLKLDSPEMYDHVHNLAAMHNGMWERLVNLNHKHNLLQEKWDSFTENIEDSREESHRDDCDERLSSIQDDLCEQISTEGAIKVLRNELKEKDDHIKYYQDNFGESLKTCDELRQALEYANKACEKYIVDLYDKTAAYDLLDYQSDCIFTNYNELATRHAAKEKELLDSQKANEDLQQRHSNTLAALERSRKVTEESLKQVKDLERQVDSNNDQTKYWHREWSTLFDKLNGKESELSRVRQEVICVESAFKDICAANLRLIIENKELIALLPEDKLINKGVK